VSGQLAAVAGASVHGAGLGDRRLVAPARHVRRRQLRRRGSTGEEDRGDPSPADARSITTNIEHAEARNDLVVVMGEQTLRIEAAAAPTRRRFTDCWRPHGESWQLIIRQITATPNDSD
jgi:hypothetical protein